jgi:hypothetical protein
MLLYCGRSIEERLPEALKEELRAETENEPKKSLNLLYSFLPYVLIISRKNQF